MSFRRRLRLAAGIAAVAACVSASVAWGVIGRGAPVATFAIRLDSEVVATAKGYELDGVASADKRDQQREYTLRIELQLTDDAGPAQAFANGQTFASVRIDLLSSGLAVLGTYELSNATVVAYRQTGDAATNAFGQELVLRSRSLAISGP